jgi:ketopantoate reductase
MRIAVIGSGGLGGYFVARLVKGGAGIPTPLNRAIADILAPHELGGST